MHCTICTEPVPISRQKRKTATVAATCSDEHYREFRNRHREARRPKPKSPAVRRNPAQSDSPTLGTGDGLHAAHSEMRNAQMAVTE